jgi:hypothetical protein
MKTQLKDQGCDNVLPGQNCRTLQEVVIDEYGTVVERLLAEGIGTSSERTLPQSHFMHHESLWSHSGLNPSLHNQKPVSECLRDCVTSVQRKSSLYHCILKVLGVNLSPETAYPDWGFHGFPQSLQANAHNTSSNWGTAAFFHVPSNSVFDNDPIIRCYIVKGIGSSSNEPQINK